MIGVILKYNLFEGFQNQVSLNKCERIPDHIISVT